MTAQYLQSAPAAAGQAERAKLRRELSRLDTIFFLSALASAELGAALPDEGGTHVWVRTAFGRFAGALTSLLYWAGTPMWLGGSVTVVAMSVYGRFITDLSPPALYLFGFRRGRGRTGRVRRLPTAARPRTRWPRRPRPGRGGSGGGRGRWW
jgi:hypothetical protein